jgi:DNA-binding NtrC family response regulator
MRSIVMNYTFLLISAKMETHWPLVLEQALASLGKLVVVSEEDAGQLMAKNVYDVIIVDAGAVRDALDVVSQLRRTQPKTRVIVATASPTWQRARELLKAGATDYIRKSQDEKKLLSDIQTALEHFPPG